MFSTFKIKFVKCLVCFGFMLTALAGANAQSVADKKAKEGASTVKRISDIARPTRVPWEHNDGRTVSEKNMRTIGSVMRPNDSVNIAISFRYTPGYGYSTPRADNCVMDITEAVSPFGTPKSCWIRFAGADTILEFQTPHGLRSLNISEMRGEFDRGSRFNSACSLTGILITAGGRPVCGGNQPRNVSFSVHGEKRWFRGY